MYPLGHPELQEASRPCILFARKGLYCKSGAYSTLSDWPVLGYESAALTTELLARSSARNHLARCGLRSRGAILSNVSASRCQR